MCMYMWYHVMYVHMLASLRIWSWPLHLWIRWMQCPSSFRPHKIKCNWNLKHVEMLKCVQTKMLRSSFTGTLQRAMSPHSAKSCVICIPTYHDISSVKCPSALPNSHFNSPVFPSVSILSLVSSQDRPLAVKNHPIIPSSHRVPSSQPSVDISCGCAPLMTAVRSSFLSPFPLPSLVVGWCRKMSKVWKEFGVMLLLLQCNYKPWPNAKTRFRIFWQFLGQLGQWLFLCPCPCPCLYLKAAVSSTRCENEEKNAIRGVLIWQW